MCPRAARGQRLAARGPAEDKGAVAEPRDGLGAQLVECFEQGGQTAFLLQGDQAAGGSEGHIGPGAEQCVEQGGGGAALEAEGQMQGQQAVEVVG